MVLFYQSRCAKIAIYVLKATNFIYKRTQMCTESTGCAASFGEMLLLIAINFHAGQLSSIVDLICQTLGNYPQIQHLLTIVKKEVNVVNSSYNYFFFQCLGSNLF